MSVNYTPIPRKPLACTRSTLSNGQDSSQTPAYTDSPSEKQEYSHNGRQRYELAYNRDQESEKSNRSPVSPLKEIHYQQHVREVQGSVSTLEIETSHKQCNVHAASRAGITVAHQNIQKYRRRSIWARVGKWRLSILLLSSIALIASLAFLCWLWTPNPSSENWSRIIRNRWVIGSATTATVMIRTACSAEAIIATSMLAALFLERQGVQLRDAAYFSMLRFSNPGPLLSLRVFLLNGRGVGSFVLIALLAIFALITTALQFSSTILLSDIGEGQLPGSLERRIRASAMEGTGLLNDMNYWAATPSVFANFLEYSEPVPPQDIITDTGISIRGFLPISNQTLRSELRSYEGMAALFDTRVICSRPSIEFSELGIKRLRTNLEDESGTKELSDFLQLKGSLSGELSIPEFYQQDSDPLNFDCTIQPGSAAMMTLCRIDFSYYRDSNHPDKIKGLISRLSLTRSDAKIDTDTFPVAIGQTFLLWDIPESCTWEKRSNETCRLEVIDIPVEQSGPWQSFTVSDSDLDRIPLRVTVCYDAIPSGLVRMNSFQHDFHVAISYATDISPEPTVNFNSTNGGRFDTTLIRNQLAATRDGANRSKAERGVIDFDLGQIDNEIKEIAKQTNITNLIDRFDTNLTYMSAERKTYPFVFDNIWQSTPNPLPVLSLNPGEDFLSTYPGSSLSMNLMLRNIFRDTFEETHNPALALQALWTMMLRSTYYDSVPFFDYNQEVTMSAVAQKLMPVKKDGLIAVTVLVLVHWVFTAAIVASFVLLGSDVVLNNSWAAILDVSTPDGNEFLGKDEVGTRNALHDVDDEENPQKRRVRLRNIAAVN